MSKGGSPVASPLPVIRSMPTVASSVGAGITAYCSGNSCNEVDVKPFVKLFSLCGPVVEVPEKYLDAITSVSGCGIAFVSQCLSVCLSFSLLLEAMFEELVTIFRGFR